LPIYNALSQVSMFGISSPCIEITDDEGSETSEVALPVQIKQETKKARAKAEPADVLQVESEDNDEEDDDLPEDECVHNQFYGGITTNSWRPGTL